MATRDSKLARSVKERLDQLSCPYTENVEENWILELVFTPGESRIRLLQWLFTKFDSKLSDILDPHNAPVDTKMDSRIQRLLFVASTLGLCGPEDADLIRGIKSGSRQVAFIDQLLDLVCIVDAAETPQTMFGSNRVLGRDGNLADQLCGACNFVSAVSSQPTPIDALLPSDIRLLPPDIVRQIELDNVAQQQKPSLDGTDKLSSPPDAGRLRDELQKLEKDLARQREILAEVMSKHQLSSSSIDSKPTIRQTVRLSLGELDQLLTSFVYCYDNELRPWCTGDRKPAAVERPPLGPTLKRLHGPLEQFVTLLNNIRSIKSSYRRLCSELHRDIGRLRQDIDKLAGLQATKGESMKDLCATFHETVDVLEESILRVESNNSSGSFINSSVVCPSIKLR